MKRGIINTEITKEEVKSENSLRPKTLEGFIGQNQIKENLSVSISAAKLRREPLDHMLFYGPPGLGKTTIAGIIANEMGVDIKTTSGPAIEKPGEIASILSSLMDGDILFIDEIHRLPRPVEEVLYSAMEDFAIDVVIGKGSSSKSIRVDLPRFTLVGATTRAGLLSAPLRDRFGIIHRLSLYEPKELAEIVVNSARLLNIPIDESGSFEIGKRSRGTPRIANRILKRVRDYAQVKYGGEITSKITDEALNLLGIDGIGLDETDRNILNTMLNVFNGGPVGLDTLAAAIGEDSETIEDVYEPYLIKCGFLNRTPRGRSLTEPAIKHILSDD